VVRPSPSTEALPDESRVSRERLRLNRLGAEGLEDSKDMQYTRAVRAKVTPSVENPSRSRMNQKLDRPRRSERRDAPSWLDQG